MQDENTVLVAIMNDKNDFEIAKTAGWYRIPFDKAPQIVKENQIRYIAFYHTKVFAAEKNSICYYAKVSRISVVGRKALFPNEAPNPKSAKIYFKIAFESLFSLEKPIRSTIPRRLLFVPTSEAKFFNATDINDIFNESILEDILWKKFVEKKISAQRQVYYKTSEKNHYTLDFAIYCKNRNINVECDGDTYHNEKEQIQNDKNRNNFLESKGWSVLRFTTQNLTQELDKTVNLICETINKYGGVQDNTDAADYHFVRRDDDMQLDLFE